MKTSGLTFIKIIIGLLAVLAIIVIGYQLYKYNFVIIKTESAVMGEVDESLNTTGIFFRNEKVFDNYNSNFIDVVRSEGERVSGGGIIARTYTDARSAELQKEIREIRSSISIYEDILKNSDSYKNASTGLADAVYQNLNDLSLKVNEGAPGAAFDIADELIISIMKEKIANGDLVSYDAVLDELKSRLKQLTDTAGSSVRNIVTNESGYFSLGNDGLEASFSMDAMDSLSVDNYDQMIALTKSDQEASENSIGKIVYDNAWYVAVKVPANHIDLIEVNDSLYIRIPGFSSEKIKCTVYDIRKDGNDAVMILRSSMITSNVLTLRCEDITVILRTHSGIQVRQSALRKVDGEDGVFVKVGMLLKYRKIKVLYSDGNTAIIEYDASVNSGLQLYDQVVYKGSNLKDGKAVT